MFNVFIRVSGLNKKPGICAQMPGKTTKPKTKPKTKTKPVMKTNFSNP